MVSERRSTSRRQVPRNQPSTVLRTVLTAVFVAALITLSAPGSAWAHELSNTRKLILQVNHDNAQLLVLFEVPGGTSADLMRVLHDGNSDGKFAQSERKTMAARLSRDALAELLITRDGKPLESTHLDWQLAPRAQGSNAILLTLLVELTGGAGRYEVSLKTEDADASAMLEVEAGEGLVLSAAVSAPDSDGISVGPLVLSPGAPLWFVVSRPEGSK